MLSTLTRVARCVPLEVGYRLADLGSEAHARLAPTKRRAVESNLRHLTGSDAVEAGTIRGVFRNYGRYLFEFLRGPRLPEVNCVLDGLPQLDRALERGRGVILAVVHSGNWHVTGSALAERGTRVHAVAGFQLRHSWTESLRERQARDGIHILERGIASTREMVRLLSRGEILALLIDGDQFAEHHGVDVPWRRATMRIPPGAARLAARTGAALVPAYALRDPGGTHRATFLDEISVGRDAEATRRATTEVAEVLFSVLCEHPGQWMIFREFFQTGAEGRTA